HEAGEYLIDGPTLLAEALDSGVNLDRVFVESKSIDDAVIDRARGVTRVREVSDGTLAKVLDLVNPNGMVAVAKMGAAPLSSSPGLSDAIGGADLLLVLVDVADPGNVGTMLRAAEASGCAGVVVAGDSTDPFSPKVVRASAGSLFRLPVHLAGDPVETLESIRSVGLRALATVVGEGRAPEDIELCGSAIVIGNEAHGLDREIVDACDGTITVPMTGRVESLNAAMAATIVLFEAARQRRASQLERAVSRVGS
ncbi:MAG: RNA methyltransferase, partial [Microthrixaceae bacterium]|nr:RNA methyltransferase [Microthrixaceae bacterium]